MRAAREGPGTYWVAVQGAGASASASRTGAVKAPPTRRAASISCRNRARKTGFPAYWACTALTAASRPERDRPQQTMPNPPAPSRPAGL